MSLVALQSLDLLVELVTVCSRPLLLLAHALSVLALELLDHLRVCLLRVRLIVEVHLLLELERLLKLLLQLFKVRLRLVALRFEELEATFPEGALLVE